MSPPGEDGKCHIVAGFPCQPFSNAGLHLGESDSRSDVIWALIQHIKKRQPRFFILENVLGLALHHRDTLELIMKALRNVFTADGDSYAVQVATFNSKDFQVPQRRRRIYIMGIRKLGRESVKIEWPTPTGQVSIRSILGHDVKLTSYKGYEMSESQTAKKNLQSVLKKVIDLSQLAGVKPERLPVIVDISASSPNWGVDESPTLTRSRGEGLSFWSLQHGRRLTIQELMKLQGVNPHRVSIARAGITKHQFGAMLGNAFSVPVMKALIMAAIEASERNG